NRFDNTAHDDAVAKFTISDRSSSVAITKSPTGLNRPGGSEIPYVLSFTNDGSSVLKNLVAIDTISCVNGKPNLVWDPLRMQGAFTISVTPTTVSEMTTDPSKVSFEYIDGCVGGEDQVKVTFPATDRLYPGDKVAISLPLFVRFGHEPTFGADYPDNQFLNRFHLDYQDDLDLPLTTTPVTTTVAVPVSQGYWITKYVREVVKPGADRTGRHGSCQGSEEEYRTGTPRDDGFERTPCIVETKPGGTSEWRLWGSNVGNLPTERLSFVDVLPVPGDVGVTQELSGLSRGSEFVPILNGNLRVNWDTENIGTYQVLYQTAANGGCVMTGGSASNDPFSSRCADWETDWDSIKTNPAALAKVTAIRVDFNWDTATGLMQPGEAVQVYFETTTPKDLPEGFAEGSYPEAWNSIGAWAVTNISGAENVPNVNRYFLTAPLKAGIVYDYTELPDTGIGESPAGTILLALGLLGLGGALIGGNELLRRRKLES
ncbi:MAG: hypothetical protein WBA28_00900, partial [Microbacteriaceae bacterium]